MDVIKTDFTESQIRIMMAILDVNNHPHLTFSNIADAIGVRTSDPNFNKVIHYLYDAAIIECFEKHVTAKFLKIKHRMLRDLLDEQKLVNEFYEYFHAHHICEW